MQRNTNTYTFLQHDVKPLLRHDNMTLEQFIVIQKKERKKEQYSSDQSKSLLQTNTQLFQHF